MRKKGGRAGGRKDNARFFYLIYFWIPSIWLTFSTQGMEGRYSILRGGREGGVEDGVISDFIAGLPI